MTEAEWDWLMRTARLNARVTGERARVEGFRSGRPRNGRRWLYVVMAAKVGVGGRFV